VGLTVRNLRHTCLTLLMQEGADLMALKKLAGHKSISRTQVYLYVTQRQLREAMTKHPLG
jgi:site-specific recombinase XerD